MSNVNNILGDLMQGFQRFDRGECTLEECRDSVRRDIHSSDPSSFPYGAHGTNIKSLTEVVFNNEMSFGSRTLSCASCRYTSNDDLTELLWDMNVNYQGSIQDWIDEYQYRLTGETCPNCAQPLHQRVIVDSLMPFILVNSEQQRVNISHEVHVSSSDDSVHMYKLAGIVYLGGYHFTSRFVEKNGNVRYHDGIETGGSCFVEGKLNTLTPSSLRRCKDRLASMVVYKLDRCQGPQSQ